MFPAFYQAGTRKIPNLSTAAAYDDQLRFDAQQARSDALRDNLNTAFDLGKGAMDIYGVVKKGMANKALDAAQTANAVASEPQQSAISDALRNMPADAPAQAAPPPPSSVVPDVAPAGPAPTSSSGLEDAAASDLALQEAHRQRIINDQYGAGGELLAGGIGSLLTMNPAPFIMAALAQGRRFV